MKQDLETMTQASFFEGFLEDIGSLQLLSRDRQLCSVLLLNANYGSQEASESIEILVDYKRSNKRAATYLIQLYSLDSEKSQEEVTNLAIAAGVEL